MIIAAFAILWIGGAKAMGNNFTDHLFVWEAQKQYNELEPDPIRIECDREDIIHLESVEKENGQILYTLSPVNSGTVSMSVHNAATDEEIYQAMYRVLPSGIIVDISTGSFSNYHVYQLLLLVFCVVLTAVLWISFVYLQRELMYSYQAIFSSGLAIWMTLLSVLLIRIWLQKDIMLNVYQDIYMEPWFEIKKNDVIAILDKRKNCFPRGDHPDEKIQMSCILGRRSDPYNGG